MNSLLLLLCLSAAPAETVGPPPVWLECQSYPLDGDTIRGDILFPLGITLRDQTIRASDFDAYESSRHRRTVEVTDEEIRRGKAATNALSELLNDGRLFISVGAQDRDVYGRVLARWMVITREGRRINVSDFMRERGFVRPERPR